MKIASAISVVSIIATAWIAPAHAQDAEVQAALKDCDRNQMTMNICAGHRHAEADRALNLQYKQTMAKQASDQAKKRLRDAQRAWIVFRDKDCLAVNGPREESGSIWPLLQSSCLAEQSERRTQDLALQACGMEGCDK